MQFCGLLYVGQFWQCLHCIPHRGNHWTRLCKCMRLILSIPVAINLFVSPTWQSSWISCSISWLPLVHCCHAVPARQNTSAPPLMFPQWIEVHWYLLEKLFDGCTQTTQCQYVLKPEWESYILFCAVQYLLLSATFFVTHWFTIEISFWAWHTGKLCSCCLRVTANNYCFVVQI
jgi:hypothetical protein